ncbi:MAG: GxxExxY protein [Candidatus Scalindua sp.]
MYTKTGLVFVFSKNQILVAVILGQNCFWIFSENNFEMCIKQTLNYLAASKLKLGLLVNFGEDSLIHKRVVL